ncbi:MAG: RNA methyltransferase [Eggerthellaceae bacterium]
MIEQIVSLDDPRLDVYARLTERELRNRLEPAKGIFIAESDKVIDRALDANYEPLSLLTPAHKYEHMQGLLTRVETAWASFHGVSDANVSGLPVFVAPVDVLSKIAGYEVTRGVLCAMRRKPLPGVKQIVQHARRIAVLEDITNHTNVGALFRSAAALGIDAILVTPACCDPLYRRAVRVSMGTVFQVPWTRIGLTEQDSWPRLGCDMLRSLGFKTAALALSDEAIASDDPILTTCEKLALVLGTEGDGLSRHTIASCDYTVRIPMAHGVDSLNVAAASAVAFWELRVR